MVYDMIYDLYPNHNSLCFISPRQVSGIENTQLVGYKSYQIPNHGGPYIYIYIFIPGI
jgi:hypothetical protein